MKERSPSSSALARPPGETIGNGAAIAQLLAREGAAVLCVDRSGERAEKTAKDISSTGAVVSSMEADITVADDCARIVKLAMTRYGRIDILINNVGIGGGGDAPAHRIEERVFDRIDVMTSRACGTPSRRSSR